ncbi:MAG: DUF6465 family protein [Lachnospiraceae bacterium]|nr:DUF6465 family protein [Lachnospiraceae bacterium]
MAQTKKTKRSTTTRSTSKKAPAQKTKEIAAAKDEAVITLNDTVSVVETATTATKVVAEEVTGSGAKSPVEKKTTRRTSEKTSTKASDKKASASKASTATQETYFEIAGEQILMEDINERIRQAWLAEGHFPSRLRTIKTYLNLEERRAYYVINGKAENKYVEF